MSENRNIDSSDTQSEADKVEALGEKQDKIKRRNDVEEIKETGNKITGTQGTEKPEHVSLERATSGGAGEDMTNTREDQEEGSSAGRSASKGPEELKRVNQPGNGKN